MSSDAGFIGSPVVKEGRILDPTNTVDHEMNILIVVLRNSNIEHGKPFSMAMISDIRTHSFLKVFDELSACNRFIGSPGMPCISNGFQQSIGISNHWHMGAHDTQRMPGKARLPCQWQNDGNQWGRILGRRLQDCVQPRQERVL
jgi:hypothetical protein